MHPLQAEQPQPIEPYARYDGMPLGRPAMIGYAMEGRQRGAFTAWDPLAR